MVESIQRRVRLRDWRVAVAPRFIPPYLLELLDFLGVGRRQIRRLSRVLLGVEQHPVVDCEVRIETMHRYRTPLADRNSAIAPKLEELNVADARGG